MKKTKLTRSLMAACSIVALSAVMYGCVHSGDDPPAPDPEPPTMEEPTAYEAGKAAIMAATTAAAAQAAFDAVDLTAVSGTELASLRAALDSKLDMLAAAAAAAARQALVDAAMCMDGTAECVAAHEALVAALMADDTTTVTALAAAQANLATVRSAKAAAAAARQALVDAAAGCTEGTQACVDAHQALVDALAADDSTSEADLAAARANLATVTMAKADADAAAQRQGLIDAAAMCTEGTQACVDAHQALVDALDADPTTSADDLDAARANLATVTKAKTDADAARTAAETRQALVDAAMCMDGTQECVDAHQALVDALDADETTTADDLAEAQANLATVQTAKAAADRADADMTTVNDAISAATTAIGALTDTSSKEDVEAARALVMAAQTALDGVENLSDDQVASLQGMINDIDTANLEAQETRIKMAEEKAEADRVAAEAAAATKAAGTKEKAIAAEADQTTDAGLGGSDHVNADTTDGNADDPYRLTITRKRGESAKIEIHDFGMADEDEDPQFMQAMDLGSGRTMHVRVNSDDEDGKVEEVVIVSTDIEAPTGVAFAKWEGRADDGAGTTPQALNVRRDGVSVDAANPADSRDVSGAALDSTTPADAAILALIKSPAFAAPGQGSSSITHTFQPADPADQDTDTPGVQARDAAMVDGTYRGAEGTYTCVSGAPATNCTVTVNAKGELTAATDGWVFTPDRGATSDQPDYDYLHYGFWLKRTTEDGVVEYNEVETFAGSSVAASDGTQLNDVEGSASYDGSAVGVYVHSVTNSDGSRASATSGHFTADASLTAYFGQTGDNPLTTDVTEVGTIPPNMLNTITGTIDNFELSGGEANVWSVSLQGTRAAGANTFSGTAKGGVGDGSLSGMYFGATAVTEATNDPASNRDMPGSVAGEFNAGFTNGSVAGAFGARKED